MNKLLVAVFGTEAAADAGLAALRTLHVAGDITLYAAGVLFKDATGVLSIRKALDAGPADATTGLAVGSLIGLIGGPVGAAAAVRDFWVVGVGLDFIEEATAHLKPGTVAVVAEVEEEGVTPTDTALEASGGHVLRRTRTEWAQEHFDHDIAAFRSEIRALQAEAAQSGGTARTRLQAALAAETSRLDDTMQRARQRVDTLRQEGQAKAESLKRQLAQAQADVNEKIEDRLKRVQSGYHARGAKLSQAWSLTKEALSV